MKRHFLTYLTIIIASIVACGNPQDTQTESSEEEIHEETAVVEKATLSESSFHLDMIIANNIAAPVKLMTEMSNAGLKHYTEGATNSTENLDNYATSEQKAMAFGVYGADMSYNSMYEKNQEMANGLITIRKLADGLGLMHLFDQASFERFENIKGNADSVKFFLFEKYDDADDYLKENEQIKLSALILTGGLIESLHLISAQMETADINEDAYNIFLSQKHTLKSLLDLYTSLEKEGHTMELKADIETLYGKFQEFDSMDKFPTDKSRPLHEAIEEVRSKLV